MASTTTPYLAELEMETKKVWLAVSDTSTFQANERRTRHGNNDDIHYPGWWHRTSANDTKSTTTTLIYQSTLDFSTPCIPTSPSSQSSRNNPYLPTLRSGNIFPVIPPKVVNILLKKIPLFRENLLQRRVQSIKHLPLPHLIRRKAGIEIFLVCLPSYEPLSTKVKRSSTRPRVDIFVLKKRDLVSFFYLLKIIHFFNFSGIWWDELF